MLVFKRSDNIHLLNCFGFIRGRGCPKAYHPACIKRDEAFFRSKAKWNCGMCLNFTSLFYGICQVEFPATDHLMKIYFQGGIYAAVVRRLHIICAILVHTPYAKDAPKMLIMCV